VYLHNILILLGVLIPSILFYLAAARLEPSISNLTSLVFIIVSSAAGILASTYLGESSSWHIGFVSSFCIAFLIIMFKSINAINVLNILSPLVCIGYAIIRVGCFMAGDGSYGVTTSLPWGMSYPNGSVPVTLTVHPTSLYEILTFGPIGVLFFIHLVFFEKDLSYFSLLCITLAPIHFIIESLRLRTVVSLGLNAPQIIDIFFFTLGLLLIYSTSSKSPN